MIVSLDHFSRDPGWKWKIFETTTKRIPQGPALNSKRGFQISISYTKVEKTAKNRGIHTSCHINSGGFPFSKPTVSPVPHMKQHPKGVIVWHQPKQCSITSITREMPQKWPYICILWTPKKMGNFMIPAIPPSRCLWSQYSPQLFCARFKELPETYRESLGWVTGSVKQDWLIVEVDYPQPFARQNIHTSRSKSPDVSHLSFQVLYSACLW